MEQEDDENWRYFAELLSDPCEHCGKGPVVKVEFIAADWLWFHSMFCNHCHHAEWWETHR